MDPNQSSSSTRRKVKFVPKPPPNRKPKIPPAKTEASDEQDTDSAQAQALLRSLNVNLARREPKVEKKPSVEVAFGPGGTSTPYLRTDGVTKGINCGKSSGSASKDFSDKNNGLTPSLTAKEDQSDTCMIDATDDTTDASPRETKREYREPWDYQHSYYPTTLPLRKPHSGDPEILDEEEFGEAASRVEYDESTINPAAELGLLGCFWNFDNFKDQVDTTSHFQEKSEQPRMIFFKLPALPLVKQPVSRKGKEKVGASEVSGESTKGSALENLSRGYMGKMLVYKSGATYLKLGETLFQVSPGSNPSFPQDVVAMNTAQKHCCVLGDLSTKAVVTPDLDSIEL